MFQIIGRLIMAKLMAIFFFDLTTKGTRYNNKNDDDESNNNHKFFFVQKFGFMKYTEKYIFYIKMKMKN